MYICFIAIIICIIPLLYFLKHNSYRCIERYYFKKHKKCYLLLQVSYFILFTTIIYNIRHICIQSFSQWVWPKINIFL